MLAFAVIWTLLLLVCYQSGAAVIDLTGAASFRRTGDRFIISVWIGLIILSDILLLAAAFTGLSLAAVGLASAAMVIASAALTGRNYLSDLRPRLSAGHIAGFMALLASVSFVTTQVVTWYDTGGYHYGIIKWFSSHGAVPGLSLVYYGYGYTSAWFALGASFNDWALEGRAAALTGGLAFLLLLLLFWVSISRILSRRAMLSDWFGSIAALLALGVITRYEIFVSPSQDLPVIILVIVTSWAIIMIGGGRETEAEGRPGAAGDALVVLLLGAGAVCMKLSALPVLAAAGLYYLFAGGRLQASRVLFGGIVTAVVLAPFLIVQALTSGCLLYPSAALCLDLPWTMGPEKIAEVTEQIIKAAQWSSITPPEGRAMEWIYRWPVVQKFQTALIILSFAAALPAFRALKRKQLRWAWWVAAMGLTGFAYTMVLGPTWRYSLGYLSTLSGLFLGVLIWRRLSAGAAGPAGKAAPAGGWISIASLFALAAAVPALSLMVNNTPAFNYLRMEIREAVASGAVTPRADGPGRLLLPPRMLNFQLTSEWRSGRPLFTVADLEVVEERAAGLTFLRPRVDYQCWDRDLLCTPFLTYPDIRLRDPRKGVGGGFVRGG